MGRKATKCDICGSAPPAPGRRICRACIARQTREYQARMKAAGLCARCGKEPAMPGRTLCEECREKSRLRMRAYRAGTGGPCDGDCFNCRYDDCIIEVTPADREREKQWERLKKKGETDGTD